MAGCLAGVGHFLTDGLAGPAAVDAVASHTLGIAAGTFGAGAMGYAALDAKARIRGSSVARHVSYSCDR